MVQYNPVAKTIRMEQILKEYKKDLEELMSSRDKLVSLMSKTEVEFPTTRKRLSQLNHKIKELKFKIDIFESQLKSNNE